ncbi:MAG: carbohydrate ABC transporter permease [candidate division KSB1 bacterium]|nr:carbohydrate ABC transporter permease [candidate division KSB1 bacterium]MDZ7300971.1 carbohydrate ABC transporter permease [candidate division KSB1 bacterium]MDZ7310351.1 carbohydrate ABC transporter permease [candidate division KSB1 bacterium]
MNRFGKILILSIAIIIAVVTLAPAVWMVSASFMPAGEASTFPPKLLPTRITYDHYFTLFTRLQLWRYLVNSLIISVSVTLISLFFNSMAGYAFAKHRFPGRDRLFRFLVSEMVIPAQVTTLPLFLMLNKVGLINTYLGVIVTGMATIYGIFLIRQFALSIPDSFIEAARMDGSSDFRIYWSVILPLCKPILITLAIFTFMGTWNDFLWPLIVMTDDSMYTLPVALANLTGEHVQDTELMMAGSVITILPVMIVFLALQKYYIGGIMASGLKE